MLTLGYSESIAMDDKALTVIPQQKKMIPASSIESPGSISSLPKMPFQLGFEFQEISSLCSWAKHLENIDKKPLFSLQINGDSIPLWHVEIDDVDIEFVTPPFNPEQRDKLESAIHTITQSLRILQKQLNEDGNAGISLTKWVSEIHKQFKNDGFIIIISQDFKSVKDQKLIKPKNIKLWKPLLAPQATIQHPLEDTIPLYFSLFGFKNPLLINFVTSLPLLNKYQKSLNSFDSNDINKFTDIFRQKVIGLIFLHALTMTAMTPMINEKLTDQENDSLLLKETQQHWNDYRQIDPKLKLNLMSRRPFSEMYKELKQVNYAHIFYNTIKNNDQFIGFDKVPFNFSKINYAEQFPVPSSKEKETVQLWKIIPSYFEDEFWQQNKETLQYLLQNGIFSTTMLRNLKSDEINSLFKDYFLQSIKSVEHPESYDYFYLDLINFSIKSKRSKYDTLSPPWLLNKDFAMGRIKKMREQDRPYGEAIIEVRAITSVQPWFLKRAGLPVGLTGDFLRLPSDPRSPNLATQALGLFDFLNDFRSDKNMIDIFYLGLPYAATHH